MVCIDGMDVGGELLMTFYDWADGSASAGLQSSDNDQVEGTQYGTREQVLTRVVTTSSKRQCCCG